MPSVSRCLFPLLLIASLLAACSGGLGVEPPITLPDIQDPLADTAAETSWPDPDESVTGGDTLADTDPDAAEAVADADPDANADADSDGPVDADDADAAPDVPQVITSCAGHCGVYLEDNPCHCHANCEADGNCCDGFALDCGCGSDADCNDANQCTTDQCVNGLCKQIPFQNCCNSDAECPGGNGCQISACLSGSCQLVPKDCNDGKTCTADLCDAATGGCVQKVQAGKCLIEGECRASGEADPASNGCQECNPSLAANAWSPKPGKCFIDGLCHPDGQANGGAWCATCDVKKSTSQWTLVADVCMIEGVCVAAGEPDAAGCGTCDPKVSTTEWTPVAGKCLIGGVCYAAGESDPAMPDCTVCEPTINKSAFILKSGFCQIDGQCVKSGATAPGAFGCKTCQPAKAKDIWSVNSGAACTDADACTTNTKCNSEGQCAGTAVAGCCKTDDDCAYLQAKAGDCEVATCVAATGKCELKTDPTCCTMGVCCDTSTKSLKPLGTPCSTLALSVEYQCNGSTVETRKLYPGCTGTAATKCSGETTGYGPWTPTTKVCGPGTTCVAGSPDVPPLCVTNP